MEGGFFQTRRITLLCDSLCGPQLNKRNIFAGRSFLGLNGVPIPIYKIGTIRSLIRLILVNLEGQQSFIDMNGFRLRTSVEC